MIRLHSDLTTCSLCNKKPTEQFIWVNWLGNIRILTFCDEHSKKFKSLNDDEQQLVFKGKMII